MDPLATIPTVYPDMVHVLLCSLFFSLSNGELRLPRRQTSWAGGDSLWEQKERATTGWNPNQKVYLPTSYDIESERGICNVKIVKNL